MTQATIPLSEHQQRAELMRQTGLLYKHFADQYRQGKNINALLLQMFYMLAGHGMAGVWPLTPSNFTRDDYAYETNYDAHVNFAESAIEYLRKKEYYLAVAEAAGVKNPKFIQQVLWEQADFSMEQYKRAIAANPKLGSMNTHQSFSYDQVMGLFLKDVEAVYNNRRRGQMPPYPLKNYHVEDGSIDPDEPPSHGLQDRDGPKPPQPLQGGAELALVGDDEPAPAVAGLKGERIGVVSQAPPPARAIGGDAPRKGPGNDT